jgi:ATP-dependent Clp protease ATP-binding subunit ClpX
VTRAMVDEHTGGKVLPLPGTDQQKTAWRRHLSANS